MGGGVYRSYCKGPKDKIKGEGRGGRGRWDWLGWGGGKGRKCRQLQLNKKKDIIESLKNRIFYPQSYLINTANKLSFW